MFAAWILGSGLGVGAKRHCLVCVFHCLTGLGRFFNLLPGKKRDCINKQEPVKLSAWYGTLDPQKTPVVSLIDFNLVTSSVIHTDAFYLVEILQ